MIKIKKIIFVAIFFIFGIESLKAEIKDGLYITVGNKAITKSDIVEEIKIILILNNISYSEDKRQELQQMAVKSAIERSIKEIEIKKNDSLKYNNEDLNQELKRLASRIKIDVDTLKSIFESNNLDFSTVKDQIKTELLWNSLIFNLYRNRLSINLEEIDEQLKLNQNKKEIEEFLISEILLNPVEQNKVNEKINEIKKKIDSEGFKNVALTSSISNSSTNGGDLGWVNENEIAKKFKSKIFNTAVGSISEPILLNEGILIYYVRDRRKIENIVDLDQLKDQLVRLEKTKILNMYSLTHYDNLRRSVAIKYFDD